MEGETPQIEEMAADTFWVKLIGFTATVVFMSYWATELNKELKNEKCNGENQGIKALYKTMNDKMPKEQLIQH